MSEKTLKIIIYTAGVVCLYCFIAIRVPSLFNAVLEEKIIPEYWENTKYGELYYYNNFIHHFREEGLPPHSRKYRFSEKHPTLNEAEILLFGDSFLDFTRMKTFPEALGDSLDLRAFYARNSFPLNYLSENGYENQKEKVLIYETAERYLYYRFTRQHTEHTPSDTGEIVEALNDVRDFIFPDNTESLYKNLISRSYITTDIFSAISTFKFDVFGYITDLTPKYYLEGDKPWLFYYDQLNDDPGSFYYEHSEQEIENFCNNIADLSNKLYKRFRLKMVFMVIPSKYTVYHKLLNDDQYNNFIPRLYARLEERGISVVPVYENFLEADTVLYYGTDTHWNKEGLSIALDETIEVIDNLNIKNNNYESSSLSWWIRNQDK